MKQVSLLAALLILLLFTAPSAHAHALLVDSSPKDNAVLASPPREAVLRFDARIEKDVSRLTLLDEKGRKLALPPRPEESSDSSPGRLVIALPPLAPGRYRLEYFVLAADGHTTPGVVRFTVSGGR